MYTNYKILFFTKNFPRQNIVKKQRNDQFSVFLSPPPPPNRYEHFWTKPQKTIIKLEFTLEFSTISQNNSSDLINFQQNGVQTLNFTVIEKQEFRESKKHN